MKRTAYLIAIEYFDPNTYELEYDEIRCAFTNFVAAKKFLDEIIESWTFNNPDQYLESRTSKTAKIKSSNPQRYNDMFISINEVPLYDKI